MTQTTAALWLQGAKTKPSMLCLEMCVSGATPIFEVGQTMWEMDRPGTPAIRRIAPRRVVSRMVSGLELQRGQCSFMVVNTKVIQAPLFDRSTQLPRRDSRVDSEAAVSAVQLIGNGAGLILHIGSQFQPCAKRIQVEVTVEEIVPGRFRHSTHHVQNPLCVAGRIREAYNGCNVTFPMKVSWKLSRRGSTPLIINVLPVRPRFHRTQRHRGEMLDGMQPSSTLRNVENVPVGPGDDVFPDAQPRAVAALYSCFNMAAAVIEQLRTSGSDFLLDDVGDCLGGIHHSPCPECEHLPVGTGFRSGNQSLPRYEPGLLQCPPFRFQAKLIHEPTVTRFPLGCHIVSDAEPYSASERARMLAERLGPCQMCSLPRRRQYDPVDI
jgi:hypothetical protein